MRPARAGTRRLAQGLVIIAGLGIAAAGASAQQTVVTYALDDVWLLPDISHPTGAPRLMTGTFTWTYDEGDFENGVGTLVQASIPWFGLGPEFVGFTGDTGSIEFTLNGNYHDHGLDVSLFFDGSLSPDTPVPIDTVRSSFDIQQGISHKGHAISGRLVQVPPPCIPDFNQDGVVDNGDIAIFVNLFLAGDIAADVNGDGFLDNGDIVEFVGLFLAGVRVVLNRLFG